MITQIKFVSVPCTDQDRALDFFTTKLGFKVATDQAMGPGQRWIELKIGSADTKLVLNTAPGDETRIGSVMPLSLQCDNVPRTVDELKAKGVEFAQDLKTEPWGSFAIVKDPDGNQFVISSK
jgi:predicted enzyme related to lactoylglutathione lyase